MTRQFSFVTRPCHRDGWSPSATRQTINPFNQLFFSRCDHTVLQCADGEFWILGPASFRASTEATLSSKKKKPVGFDQDEDGSQPTIRPQILRLSNLSCRVVGARARPLRPERAFENISDQDQDEAPCTRDRSDPRARHDGAARWAPGWRRRRRRREHEQPERRGEASRGETRRIGERNETFARRDPPMLEGVRAAAARMKAMVMKPM